MGCGCGKRATTRRAGQQVTRSAPQDKVGTATSRVQMAKLYQSGNIKPPSWPVVTKRRTV